MDANLEAEIVARESALLKAVTTNDVALLDDLLHDELERVNDPVFFHQFAAHAAQHNLLYVTAREASGSAAPRRATGWSARSAMTSSWPSR